MTGDILDRSLKALRSVQRAGLGPEYKAAIEYRNWLMVAMLALMPLRRDNFSQLSVEQHLRCSGGDWSFEIPAKNAKQKKPIKMPVPLVLQPHLQFCFEQVRPILLSGRTSDRLWISNRHTPMADHSVYIAITDFTSRAFGQRINPHKFRHIGATSAVVTAPEKLDSARALLGHADIRRTQESYIIAHSVAASREQAGLIAELRRRLRPEPCDAP